MKEQEESVIEIDRRYHRDKLMDLIGHPPGWLLQSGIGLLGCITILLLWITWFIRYPDVIEAQIVLTSSNPPIEIHLRQTGMIDTLLVRDGDTVVEGQHLGYLDQTADVTDIYVWQAWLISLSISSPEDTTSRTLPVSLQLGNLQNGYAVTVQKYFEWKRSQEDESWMEKIKVFESEIHSTHQFIESLSKQIEFYDQEASLQEKQWKRDQTLLQSGTISAQEYEKTTSANLAFKRQRENLTSSIYTQEMRIDQLEASIVDQKIQYHTRLNSFYTDLIEQIQISIADILLWEEQYVLKAKRSGRLVLPTTTLTKKYYNPEESIIAIVPLDLKGKVFARATVPSIGLGKIEIGNLATIHLDAWPYKQFGSLRGTVETISPLALSGKENARLFEILVVLQNSHLSTSGTALPLRPEETGKVRIITRNRRILARLYDNLLRINE